jgi:hypothetical protein
LTCGSDGLRLAEQHPGARRRPDRPDLRRSGFGDWRISTALITGFMAKESVVSTLNVLFGGMAKVQAALPITSVLAPDFLPALHAVRRGDRVRSGASSATSGRSPSSSTSA